MRDGRGWSRETREPMGRVARARRRGPRRRIGWCHGPQICREMRHGVEPPVSRRDLLHILNALWRLSNGVPDVGVPVADLDQAIGRGHGDMRTPLNLQSLSDDGRVAQAPDGTWALTADGVAWIKRDRELSER